MPRQCPFCWDQHIMKVAKVSLNGTGRTRVLLECGDCEKWYWEDSGEEVRELAGLCLNRIGWPVRCEEVVVHPTRESRFASPATKIREFNHICSECSQKRFYL